MVRTATLITALLPSTEPTGTHGLHRTGMSARLSTMSKFAKFFTADKAAVKASAACNVLYSLSIAHLSSHAGSTLQNVISGKATFSDKVAPPIHPRTRALPTQPVAGPSFRTRRPTTAGSDPRCPIPPAKQSKSSKVSKGSKV